MDRSSKLPISALVISYNEGHLLEACLNSIQFCEQIVVVDLGSEDNTGEVAKKCNAEVINMERLPVVEMVHMRVIERLIFDLVLLLDPDEVIQYSLSEQIKSNLSAWERSKVGIVYVPWIFFYKEKKLKGTRWGGVLRKSLLINRNRVLLSDNVHIGRRLKKGFEHFIIEFQNDNYVKHYWMLSREQLIEKHKRYLKKSGKAKYESGERTNFLKIIKTSISAFIFSYFRKKGYLDNITGLFLSIFWAWYVFHSQRYLYRFQKQKQQVQQSREILKAKPNAQVKT